MLIAETLDGYVDLISLRLIYRVYIAMMPSQDTVSWIQIIAKEGQLTDSTKA